MRIELTELHHKLLDNPKLTRSEAKFLDAEFGEIMNDCFCNEVARRLLQKLIKEKLNESGTVFQN